MIFKSSPIQFSFGGIPYVFHKPVQSAPYRARNRPQWKLLMGLVSPDTLGTFGVYSYKWWYEKWRLENLKCECNQDASSVCGGRFFAQKARRRGMSINTVREECLGWISMNIFSIPFPNSFKVTNKNQGQLCSKALSPGGRDLRDLKNVLIMGLSINGGTPSHPFLWYFPWNKTNQLLGLAPLMESPRLIFVSGLIFADVLTPGHTNPREGYFFKHNHTLIIH